MDMQEFRQITFLYKSEISIYFIYIMKQKVKVKNVKIFSPLSEQSDIVIAVDISGSVSGNTKYWQIVQNIIEQNVFSHIILWDSNYELVSIERLIECADKRQGRGGTQPHLILQAFLDQIKNFNKILIIVTDGEVSSSSVQTLTNDLSLVKQKFKKVICHIVSMSPNLSVSCPFTRDNQCQVYSYSDGLKSKKVQTVLKKQDLEIVKTLEKLSYQEFIEKYDMLQAAIINLNMGMKENLQLKGKLIELRKRLVKEISKQKDDDFGKKILECLDSSKLQEALDLTKKMHQSFYQVSHTKVLEEKFQQLIYLCGNLENVFDLNQIRGMRVRRAGWAEEGDMQLAINQSLRDRQLFQCPILLQEDCPVIMVSQGRPILQRVDDKIVNDILNSPFNLFKYPNILHQLTRRIVHPVGLKFIAEYIKDRGIFKNPFTNLPILGVIPLGPHQNHIKIGNRTLSLLLTGGKKAGNFNLLFALLCKLSKNGSLPLIKPIIPQISRHLSFRLRNTLSTASLSGLLNYNSILVPTMVAVWYCLISIKLKIPIESNPVYYHINNWQYLEQVLQNQGLRFSDYQRNQFRLLNGMLKLLDFIKKNHKNKENLINSLTYERKMQFQFVKAKKEIKSKRHRKSHAKLSIKVNSNKRIVKTKSKKLKIRKQKVEKKIADVYIKLNDYLGQITYLFYEKTAPQSQIQEVLSQLGLNLTRQQILTILSSIDRSRTKNDVGFQYGLFQVKIQKEFTRYWNMPFKEYQIQINRQTMRPIYKLQNGRTWKQEMQQIFGKPFSELKFLSLYKLFGDFVVKFNFYPDRKTFLIFLMKIVSNQGRVLPEHTQAGVDLLFVHFQNVIKQVSPEDFIKKFKNSTTVNNRMEIQAS